MPIRGVWAAAFYIEVLDLFGPFFLHKYNFVEFATDGVIPQSGYRFLG